MQLKRWNLKVIWLRRIVEIGDFVKQDEEIATIETDKVLLNPSSLLLRYSLLMLLWKIDVAVNAPEQGTIKEFLANEEDTVTVGQDIVKMELGGAPAGGKKEQGGQEPKEPAADKQPTSSDPEPKKDESKESESPPSAPKEEPAQDPRPSPPPKKPSAPAPKPQESKKPGPGPRPEPKPKDDAPLGNREERKVYLSRALAD